ncbi:MAG: retropepsin-like aspartic protease [Burkholderiales bacterium]|nr:retropepsin-like aspartic protease [Burkholderiales bacterium]
MKRYVYLSAVWFGLIAAGFFIADRLTREPPVTRSLEQGAREIAIPVSRDGHYYLDGAINGVPLKFMIDTGATYVSVGADFARTAGLPKGVPGYFGTANGMVEGEIVRNQDVRADAFRVSGLSVAVTPAMDEVGLLGQNFLRRFEISQSDGTLRLRLPAASTEPPR